MEGPRRPKRVQLLAVPGEAGHDVGPGLLRPLAQSARLKASPGALAAAVARHLSGQSPAPSLRHAFREYEAMAQADLASDGGEDLPDPGRAALVMAEVSPHLQMNALKALKRLIDECHRRPETHRRSRPSRTA
jgi:hypothetical protein